MGWMEELPVGDGRVVVHRYESIGRRGRCLLVPPFRLAALALEPVADALVAEGFDVVTIDPRDHVGLGSGTIGEFRLSSLVEDCRATMQRYDPTCVVAVSLGARAALRALGGGSDQCPAAVFLTPVVDVGATLRVVLERDWFEVRPDDVPERVPVLGIDINAPRFLRDCEEADLVTASSAVADLAAYGGRLTLLPGTSDPWVELAAVRRLVDGAQNPAVDVTVRPVECDRHTFHEDPDLALRLVGAMIQEVRAIHDAETISS